MIPGIRGFADFTRAHGFRGICGIHEIRGIRGLCTVTLRALFSGKNAGGIYNSRKRGIHEI